MAGCLPDLPLELCSLLLYAAQDGELGEAITPQVAAVALLDLGRALPEEAVNAEFLQPAADAEACIKFVSRVCRDAEIVDVQQAQLIPGALWGLAKLSRADPALHRILASDPGSVAAVVAQAACVARKWESYALSPFDLATLAWSLSRLPVATAGPVALEHASEILSVASAALASAEFLGPLKTCDLLQLMTTVAGLAEPVAHLSPPGDAAGEGSGLGAPAVAWSAALRGSLRQMLRRLAQQCQARVPDFEPDAIAALLSVLQPYVAEIHPLSPPVPSGGGRQMPADSAGLAAAQLLVACLQEAAGQLLRGARASAGAEGARTRQSWTLAEVTEVLDTVRQLARPSVWSTGGLPGCGVVKATARFAVAALAFMAEVPSTAGPGDGGGDRLSMRTLEAMGGVAHLCAVPPRMLQVAAPRLADRLLASAANAPGGSAAQMAAAMVSAAALGGDLAGPDAVEALVPRAARALEELSGQDLHSLRLAACLLRALAVSSSGPSGSSLFGLPCFKSASLAVARSTVRSLQALVDCRDELVLPALLYAFAVLSRQSDTGAVLRESREVTDLFGASVVMLVQRPPADGAAQVPLPSFAPLPISDMLWACGHASCAMTDRGLREDLGRLAVRLCSECVIWWATLASHGDAPLSNAVARLLWASVVLSGVSPHLITGLREVLAYGGTAAGPAKVLLALYSSSWVDLDTVVAMLWVLTALGLLRVDALAAQLESLKGRVSSGNVAPVPSLTWTWALLWELLLLVSCSHGANHWPSAWLEQAPQAWAVEWAAPHALRPGSKAQLEQLSASLARLGVQHVLEAEVTVVAGCRGFLVDAILSTPSGEVDPGADKWCVEFVEDVDAAGLAVREAADPLATCSGSMQVKRLALAHAGFRVVEVAGSLFASEGDAAAASKGLATFLHEVGALPPPQAAPAEDPPPPSAGFLPHDDAMENAVCAPAGGAAREASSQMPILMRTKMPADRADEAPVDEPAALPVAAAVAEGSIEAPVDEPAAPSVADVLAEEPIEASVDEPAALPVAAAVAAGPVEASVDEPAALPVAAAVAEGPLEAPVDKPAALPVAAAVAEGPIEVTAPVSEVVAEEEAPSAAAEVVANPPAAGADDPPPEEPGAAPALGSSAASPKQAESDRQAAAARDARSGGRPATEESPMANDPPAVDSGNDDVVRRRLHEASSRAERLARQRMEEQRQRMEEQRQRLEEEARQMLEEEAKRIAAVQAAEKPEAAAQLEHGSTDAAAVEDSGEAPSSPAEESCSAESVESSYGEGSLADDASDAGGDQHAPQGLPAAGAPAAGYYYQPPSYHPAQSLQVDGPPPGEWGEQPASSYPGKVLPYSPYGSERSGTGKTFSVADTPPDGVPAPGTVVIEMAGNKRRRVTLDASITLKELLCSGQDFLASDRQLCIMDCISAETHERSRSCPLPDRPVLFLSTC
uniref:Uncharacterized protein n=1 Tax=Alexandrium monilatum TaxID=311494 RepID=A0A7S4Q9W6_9DINO